jgi:hypothetical protein
MPIPPHLQRKLEQVLGSDAAEDLVSWMEGMDSSRADIAELRQEMQVGFARIDARFAGIETIIERRTAALETMLERRTADLMKWSFVFWVGAVTSIAILAKVLR